MSRIHPSALIEKGARIADDAEIGPGCCIGADVEIGPGSVLIANVVIVGRTTIGAGSRIHPFASLGQPPQSIGFQGAGSGLSIGRDTVIREHVTMNTGTNKEGKPTQVGDGGLFLPGSHVAHDCRVGNHVVFEERATLAGHVTIGDHATIGGQTAIHQFSRIGKYSVVGGSTAVGKDIVPYAIAAGYGPQLRGLNVAGLRRHNFPANDIRALRDAYREIFLGGGSYTERIFAVAEKFKDSAVVMEVIDFITADKSRPICTVTLDADD
jgi:UDP-N-acetylglucosamine acyltransferase